ncbi:NADP-dependent phosphogluconate dehydrogenase [Nanoarchaeota archaeon]
MGKIGLVGLAVMGKSLALNIADHGFEVVVYNRTAEHTNEFMEGSAAGKKIQAAFSPSELVSALEAPRVVMMMVKDTAVDAVIAEFAPLLAPGDTLIDGGNSYFMDTDRRAIDLEKQGIHFLGVGISGGEEGARYGPSIMPGGQEEAYAQVSAVFEAISAKVDGEPCVAYIGPRSAGHFVKMVHNGIEYAMMQAIAEAYQLMLDMGLSYEDMHNHFKAWSQGRLGSFLIEITADIMEKRDGETGKPILDVIKDTAGDKGTGKWTVDSALELGIPVPSISAAYNARLISAQDRKNYPQHEKPSFDVDKELAIANIEKSLYSSFILSYAQGFNLLQAASDEFNYSLNLADIAKVWRGGCIIRSKILEPMRKALTNQQKLVLAFQEELHGSIKGLRETVSLAVQLGIPIPAFGQSLAFFDSCKERLPGAALIQAQRDYFGAHTYQRIDKEGNFHTNWNNEVSKDYK